MGVLDSWAESDVIDPLAIIAWQCVIIGALLILLAFALRDRMIIAENDIGFLLFDGNELTVGSKIGDPPKLRLTSPINSDGGGGGCVSYNASRQAGVVCDGHQRWTVWSKPKLCAGNWGTTPPSATSS